MLETSKSAIFDKNVNYPAQKKLLPEKSRPSGFGVTR